MITWKVDRSQLNRLFAQDVHDLLSTDRGNWFVTYGHRTHDEQAVLYARYQAGGALAAPPGTSAHESGLAVDVTLIKDNRDDWNYADSDWRRLVAIVLAHPRLHSLDNIGDTDHIEAANWHRIAQMRA